MQPLTMTQVTNTRHQSSSRIGSSKDDHSIMSKSCRSNRRSSIGSTAELKYRFRSTQHKQLPSFCTATESDDDDLSECSTILSSMELSGSSLLSLETKQASHDLPLPLEDENETSGHVLKDVILHKYDKSYTSPSPSPKTDTLNISDTMKHQLRFGGLDQSGPKFPESQDRRKMLSRWASEGHMTSAVDNENNNGEKTIRDKPPTSPVRRSRAMAAVGVVAPLAPLAETDGDNSKKKIPMNRTTGSTASTFNRRASTGAPSGTEHPLVQLCQERASFQAPVSPVKPDRPPTCPDRRKQFVRRHSTGSSESLESMIICRLDDDEEEDGVQKRRGKRKSRRPSKRGSLSTGEKNKGHKKKSKKKSSKLKKEKSSKKIKDYGAEMDEPSGSSESSDFIGSICKDSMSNESLFSLLVQMDPARPSTQSSSEMIETSHSDENLEYQSTPRVTFSRCASTGVISGDGVVMRKAKFEGTTTTTTTTPVELKSSKKSIFTLWGKLKRK